MGGLGRTSPDIQMFANFWSVHIISMMLLTRQGSGSSRPEGTGGGPPQWRTAERPTPLPLAVPSDPGSSPEVSLNLRPWGHGG